MTTQTASEQRTIAHANTSFLIQSFAAMAFGVAVIFAVGFLPTDAAHNAAHDTRHTLAFPCH
jgi:cobalt transporter subunit CbtB